MDLNSENEMDEPPTKRSKLTASSSLNENTGLVPDLSWDVSTDWKLPDELNEGCNTTSYLSQNNDVGQNVELNNGQTLMTSSSLLSCSSNPSTTLSTLILNSLSPGNTPRIRMTNNVSALKVENGAFLPNSSSPLVRIPLGTAVSATMASVNRFQNSNQTLGISASPVPTAGSVLVTNGPGTGSVLWPVSAAGVSGNVVGITLPANKMIVNLSQGAIQRTAMSPRFQSPVMQRLITVSATSTNGPASLPRTSSITLQPQRLTVQQPRTMQLSLPRQTSAPSLPSQVSIPPSSLSNNTTSQTAAMSGTSAALSGPTTMPGTADPEKRKLIQHQLILLLHAHKCQRKEPVNGGPVLPQQDVCLVTHCHTMKNVLRHMTDCQKGKLCKVPHCASSRQIITHWKNCTCIDCPVCYPLRNNNGRQASGLLPATTTASSSISTSTLQPMSPPQADMTQAYVALGLTPPSRQQQQQLLMARSAAQAQVISGLQQPQQLSGNIGGHDQLLQQTTASLANASKLAFGSAIINNIPNHPVKDWHRNVKEDLRAHLVQKLVLAIIPTPDPAQILDKRINGLLQYAQKVEGDMYETANSKEEYYHFLAEKIYKIQKELEEKRQKRINESRDSSMFSPNAMTFGHQGNGGSMQNGLSSGSLEPSVGNQTSSAIQLLNSPAAVGLAQQQLQETLAKQLDIKSKPNASISLAQLVSAANSNRLHTLGNSGGPQQSPSNNSSASTLTLSSMTQQFGGTVSTKVECDDSADDFKTSQSACDNIVKTEPLDVKIKMEIKSEPNENADNAAIEKLDEIDASKDDPEMSGSTTAKTTPVSKKVWKSAELRQILMPTLEKLYRLEPESLPFRQPVDPVLLQIPDYFDVVKKPIDLSTIKRKLDTGVYQDPWQYVDDVWLMFDNAWLYNRRSSKVHKYCTKLADLFESEIDGVMREQGFCCGRKYVFCPQVLCCYGKPMCTIPVNAVYYSYQNRYVYCEKCFLEVQGEEVELVDDPTQPSMRMRKDEFIKTKNSELELEPLVECTQCGRKQHQVCSLHMEQIWPNSFVCNHCCLVNGVKRRENKYVAKRLPQTKLGTYLENRVNSFLKKKDSGAGEVTIRVLCSSEKVVEVKSGMKLRYCKGPDGLAESFPYIAKAVFAFEEIDGVDVCFFGMHVQEYGSNCPPPNSRRVYIAYLDSVNFFQPRHFRTAVYHEILIGYLDYVKNLGYTMGHIWACPPSEGDDYIFHCHPPDMKIPKAKRLSEWYKKMLDKAIIERVVIDYKDVMKDALESGLQCVTEMPYFEGDFWPNVHEESITELEQEEEDQRKRKEVEAAISDDAADEPATVGEEVEASQTGKKKGQKGKTATKKKNSKQKNTAHRKTGSKLGQPGSGNDLTAKLFITMEKHKEVFFVVRLRTLQEVSAGLPPIKDPDTFVTNDLMDGRDAFLMMAREKHYEFSSLRRAKHSSMAMLFELHNQSKDNFVYTCNSCRANIETHFHCIVCDDFDLCVPCYQKNGHVHKMEKIGLDLDEGMSTDSPLNPQEARRLSIQRCIQSLVHACNCHDLVCRIPSCQKMKRVMTHTKSCRRKTNGGCPVCKQLIALCCYHAKHCSDQKCLVPFCLTIKQKLHQQQLAQRMQQAHMMRRRMALMQRGIAPAATPPTIAAAPAFAVSKPIASASMAASRQGELHTARNPTVNPLTLDRPLGSGIDLQQPGIRPSCSITDSSSATQIIPPNIDISSIITTVNNQISGSVGGQGAMQRLFQVLRSPQSPQQTQQVLNILRNCPVLLQAFAKRRQLVSMSANQGQASTATDSNMSSSDSQTTALVQNQQAQLLQQGQQQQQQQQQQVFGIRAPAPQQLLQRIRFQQQQMPSNVQAGSQSYQQLQSASSAQHSSATAGNQNMHSSLQLNATASPSAVSSTLLQGVRTTNSSQAAAGQFLSPSSSLSNSVGSSSGARMINSNLVMLSQTQSNFQPGLDYAGSVLPSGESDAASLTLQDQLSRYADQL